MIENKEYLSGYSTFKYPIKGPKGRPLTTTDDVAIKILVDEDDDYAGYVSLTDILVDLIATVKGDKTTEEIDTLQEVYNFLTLYKNTEILDVATKEDIDSLNFNN